MISHGGISRCYLPAGDSLSPGGLEINRFVLLFRAVSPNSTVRLVSGMFAFYWLNQINTLYLKRETTATFSSLGGSNTVLIGHDPSLSREWIASYTRACCDRDFSFWSVSREGLRAVSTPCFRLNEQRVSNAPRDLDDIT